MLRLELHVQATTKIDAKNQRRGKTARQRASTDLFELNKITQNKEKWYISSPKNVKIQHKRLPSNQAEAIKRLENETNETFF